MENHARRPEVIEARRTGHGDSRRFSATEQENRFYFARLLPDGNVLRLSVAAARVRELESGYLWSARAAVVLACVLLFAIGTAASRRFSEPIARLTEAASAIAAGLPRDLPREGGEEVQLLAAALQRMKDSLARAAERAEAERRLTALVFEKLPDGLVVLDSRLHVLEANERFSQMIGIATPAGRALYDVVRLRAVYEVFEASLKSGEGMERTVRLADELVWQVLVVPLPAGSRAAAVGVLRDVTRLERTESMRRTFVADVSHELRTPIASIAAAAETLEEAAPDEAERRELIGLIQRQSARMKELIDDLMDLAQIESGAVELIAGDRTGGGPAARGRAGPGRQCFRAPRPDRRHGRRERLDPRRPAPASPGRPQSPGQRDQVLSGRRNRPARRRERSGLGGVLRLRPRAGDPARGEREDLPALLPGRPLAIEDAARHGTGPGDREAPRTAPPGNRGNRKRGRAGKPLPGPAAGRARGRHGGARKRRVE